MDVTFIIVVILKIMIFLNKHTHKLEILHPIKRFNVIICVCMRENVIICVFYFGNVFFKIYFKLTFCFFKNKSSCFDWLEWKHLHI